MHEQRARKANVSAKRFAISTAADSTLVGKEAEYRYSIERPHWSVDEHSEANVAREMSARRDSHHAADFWQETAASEKLNASLEGESQSLTFLSNSRASADFHHRSLLLAANESQRVKIVSEEMTTMSTDTARAEIVEPLSEEREKSEMGSELRRPWFEGATEILCLNPYPNGITFSSHKVLGFKGRGGAVATDAEETLPSENAPVYWPNQFDLRLKETRDFQLPQGRYLLHKENYKSALLEHLTERYRANSLGSTLLYFGVTSDPFFAFERKYDVTMTCLEVLAQLTPGLIVVQTRSPKVISALSLLRSLKERLILSLSVESPIDRVINHYTPGQPRAVERLFAADRLREEGLPVTLKVSPCLPYGDFYHDGWKFSEVLVNHADFISFGSLSNGSPSEDMQLRSLALARKLELDRQFQLLRPQSYRLVMFAVEATAPEKLNSPAPLLMRPSQLSLFPG